MFCIRQQDPYDKIETYKTEEWSLFTEQSD